MSEFEDLTLRFSRSVAAQTDAIARGDGKAGNEHARHYIRIFEKLRDAGDEGRDALAALLQHERADVRGMAAAFLLRYRHHEARSVLEELARGTGLAAFGASECLKRWEEGTWQLDPEPHEGT